MLTAWFMGLLLNLLVVFLWRCRYIEYRDINTGNKYWSRMRVNIIIAILFIIISLIPILNIILPICIWIPLIWMEETVVGGCNDEWRFPKWMTKTIE